jgi:dTDP-L-rhamnose 4-epimerase
LSSILVTGGAGFIGSHTVQALIGRGHRVRVLDNLEPQVHAESAGWPAHLHADAERIAGDVRNADAVAAALEGIDAVIHLAALTGVGQSMYERSRYEAVNGYGTLTLLDAIAAARPAIRRLVVASSRAVYGEGSARCPEHGLVHPFGRAADDLAAGRFDVHCPNCARVAEPAPTPETRELRPVSIYGQTKAWQEVLARAFARETGIPTVLLRYFNVYGSRQSLRNPYTGIVSIFFSQIRAGRPIRLYEDGTPTRDFVHVEDVVRANLLALEADVPPASAFNVGSGVETPLAALAGALGRALGGEAPSIRTVDTYRVGDIHACHADLRRARRLLGYRPTVSLDAGLREFVAWAGREESLDLSGAAEAELAEHSLLGHPPAVTAPAAR